MTTPAQKLVRNKDQINLEQLSELTNFLNLQHTRTPRSRIYNQIYRFNRIERSDLNKFVDQLYQERKKRPSVTKKLTGKHKNPLPEKHSILEQNNNRERILNMKTIQDLGKGSSKNYPPYGKHSRTIFSVKATQRT